MVTPLTFLGVALVSLSIVAGEAILDEQITSLLITRSAPHPSIAQCLKSSYRGAYGGASGAQDHLYLPGAECLASDSSFVDLDAGSIVPLPLPRHGRVVWVGQAGVDPELKMAEASGDMMESWQSILERASALMVPVNGAQQVIAQPGSVEALQHSEPLTLLHASPTSLIMHVPDSFLPIFDTLLPLHLVPVALPSAKAAYEPVPSHLVKHLADITANLKFSPQLDRIVSEGLTLDDIRRGVRWLTGEAPSGIKSRHSFSDGAIKAAHWLKSKVEATGAACSLQPFMYGFAPNVICQYPSLHESTERVILSAHYDSRGSLGLLQAPGGDDDGSGSGHLLGVAEAIKSQQVEFERSVTLAFFAGEEQGLFGSHAYAEYLHGINATVLLHIQADMLAYHDYREPLQLGLPEYIGNPEAAYLVGNLSQIYSPELLIGRTAVCCSDHQSFVAYGFPATHVFERNGFILDPMYHNSGDISQRENYDFGQVVSIAKVTMAAVLTVAGYRIAT